MIRIAVQTDDFDVGIELGGLESLGGGGIASFIGVVRGGGGLMALELEHYPAMTEAALTAIAEQARNRWSLLGTLVVHRYGRLGPGDRIVLVGAAASHRGAAISAMQFIIDRIKTDAPFWKREHFGDGAARWVEARDQDDDYILCKHG